MDTPAQRLENLRESRKLETLGQSAAEGNGWWESRLEHVGLSWSLCSPGLHVARPLRSVTVERRLARPSAEHPRPNADALSVQSLGVEHSVLLPLGALPLGALPQ